MKPLKYKQEDIVAELAESTDLPKTTIRKVLKEFGARIERAVLEGEVFRFTGYFTVKVKDMKPRKMFIPATGETIEKQNYKKVKIKPGRVLTDLVKS
jgi:nucleoid DNA-binding protein